MDYRRDPVLVGALETQAELPATKGLAQDTTRPTNLGVMHPTAHSLKTRAMSLLNQLTAQALVSTTALTSRSTRLFRKVPFSGRVWATWTGPREKKTAPQVQACMSNLGLSALPLRRVSRCMGELRCQPSRLLVPVNMIRCLSRNPVVRKARRSLELWYKRPRTPLRALVGMRQRGASGAPIPNNRASRCTRNWTFPSSHRLAPANTTFLILACELMQGLRLVMARATRLSQAVIRLTCLVLGCTSRRAESAIR
eukprot:Rmarinus@m.20626